MRFAHSIASRTGPCDSYTNNYCVWPCPKTHIWRKNNVIEALQWDRNFLLRSPVNVLRICCVQKLSAHWMTSLNAPVLTVISVTSISSRKYSRSRRRSWGNRKLHWHTSSRHIPVVKQNSVVTSLLLTALFGILPKPYHAYHECRR